LLALGAVGVAGWTVQEGLTEQASPWTLAHVITAACLSVLASVRAVTEGRSDLARLGGWLAPVALIAAAGWAGERLHVADPLILLAAGAALSSLLLAALAAPVLDRSAPIEGASGETWPPVLAPAWAESGIVAG